MKEYELHRIDDENMYVEIDGVQCYLDSIGADIVVAELNELKNNRRSIAESFDKYQAKVGYIIGKYSKMFNRDSKEFFIMECIANDLNFDLESMEAKDDW